MDILLFQILSFIWLSVNSLDITEILNTPLADTVLKVLLIPGGGYIIQQIRIIKRKFILIGFKQDANTEALQRQFANGYYDIYQERLNQKMKENNFVLKGGD